MQFVWIVTATGAHDTDIEGVFDSLEAANEYANDQTIDLPNGAMFRAVEKHEVLKCTQIVTTEVAK